MRLGHYGATVILEGTVINSIITYAFMKKVVYIEGSHEMDNGDLRKAFAKLLEKELSGNMPKVVMGDGKNQAIDKFHSTPLAPGEQRFLLVDSDGPVIDKETVCSSFNEEKPNRKTDCTIDNTFLMVQEAEAWVLSQPEILHKNKIETVKLPQRNVMEIPKPSEMLALLYKDSGKEYHKIRDFSRLLPEIDTIKLKAYFEEFDALIKGLKM